jgi:hypothetical protein
MLILEKTFQKTDVIIVKFAENAITKEKPNE